MVKNLKSTIKKKVHNNSKMSKIFTEYLLAIVGRNKNPSFYYWAGDWVHINFLYIDIGNRIFTREFFFRSKKEKLLFFLDFINKEIFEVKT